MWDHFPSLASREACKHVSMKYFMELQHLQADLGGQFRSLFIVFGIVDPTWSMPANVQFPLSKSSLCCYIGATHRKWPPLLFKSPRPSLIPVAAVSLGISGWENLGQRIVSPDKWPSIYHCYGIWSESSLPLERLSIPQSVTTNHSLSDGYFC